MVPFRPAAAAPNPDPDPNPNPNPNPNPDQVPFALLLLHGLLPAMTGDPVQEP